VPKHQLSDEKEFREVEEEQFNTRIIKIENNQNIETLEEELLTQYRPTARPQVFEKLLF
jgi:hypothetical protein